MDDAKQAAGCRELALQGPLDARPLDCDDSRPVFFPLRLLLQPSGPVVELTRPDMRLPLPDISRRHCRFLFTDGAWEVFDLDSLNGIFVNGERVKHAVLRDRDILTIGGFRFQIGLGDAAMGGDSASAEEFIHRIADALPRAAADSESQRKAS
jgi:hypothetical protein